MTVPRVLVLSLGGTITMSSGAKGVVPTLSAADLVAAVPSLGGVAELEAETFLTMPGAHLGFHDLVTLARRIAGQKDASGVVVIQGTDTIEETAMALDLLVEADFPLVVTGAMRNPTLPGADGPANLLAATRVAAAATMRGLGTLVVMNDEIHAARYVQKAHASSPSAFRSPLSGPIGFVSEDRIIGLVRPVPLPPLGGTPKLTAPAPRVAHLVFGIGDDGRTLLSALEGGCDGLVLEASGGGHVSPAVAEAITIAASRVPVVVSTRTRGGATLRSTYGFVGGEMDLRDRGAIFSGIVDPNKSRVALALLLAAGRSSAEIAVWFETAGMPCL